MGAPPNIFAGRRRMGSLFCAIFQPEPAKQRMGGSARVALIGTHTTFTIIVVYGGSWPHPGY
jgi:hypothetical protein